MTRLAEKVYAKLRLVPKGKVTTYKLLAEAVGTKAYRAIGQILANNPYAPEVPCHRVVASNGKLGGFMGSREEKNVDRKMSMLAKEGVQIEKMKVVNFDQALFRF